MAGAERVLHGTRLLHTGHVPTWPTKTTQKLEMCSKCLVEYLLGNPALQRSTEIFTYAMFGEFLPENTKPVHVVEHKFETSYANVKLMSTQRIFCFLSNTVWNKTVREKQLFQCRFVTYVLM